MKYGFNYYPSFPYYEDEEVEYVVFKNANVRNFEGLSDFHTAHPSVTLRLVTTAAEVNESNSLINTAIALNGIVVLNNEIADEQVIAAIAKCKEAGVRFSFYNPITKWDILDYILTLGVHDVTVGEEIAFDIINVSKVCKKNNVKLFVYCNVAQNGCINGKVNDFYVRPEDVKYYENYVDCMLIFSQNKFTPVDVFYEVYAKDKEWKDGNSFIIIGLEENFDGQNVPDLFTFGEYRLDCQKNCIKGGDCTMCMTIRDFSLALTEKNLTIVEDN